MSIRTRVIGCFLAILILFGGVSLYNYSRFQKSNARLILVNELFMPLSRLIVQLQANIYNLSENARLTAFKEGLSESGTFSRMVRDLYPYLIQKKFTLAEQLLAKQSENDAKLTVGELSTLISRAKQSFESMEAASDRQHYEGIYSALRSQLQGISKRVDDECQKITLAAQGEARDNLFSSLFLSIFVGLFGILSVVFSSRVLRQLPRLVDSIRKIAGGDWDQSSKIESSDPSEIAILAREYNRMLGALEERDKRFQLQQKELLQSEKLAAVGQLSAEVVHEIRNPLNSISLNIDWLSNELSDSGREITKTVNSISREIERLNQITESYLVRSRIPLQDSEKTEVNELISEILEFSKEEDRARNIQIDAKLWPEEIFVRTDRSRLKQAFLNVFRNAREAMPRGGKLRVVSEASENVYRIHVSDSGFGMNDGVKRQTFNPFFTTKPNGTGLGLTLTKNIVEEAQGSLLCDSQPGVGTTFTFQFPA